MTTAFANPRVVADALPRNPATQMLLVVCGATFIGLSAQLYSYLPGNPVPITGQTFAVLLTAAALGVSRGVAATVLYAAAGLAGFPWFAGSTSGLVVASLGYIVGFGVAAAIVGALAQRVGTASPVRTFLTMLAGSAAIYAIGVPWLMAADGLDWGTALALGAAPFLLSDLIKAGLAAGIFAAWAIIRRRRGVGA